MRGEPEIEDEEDGPPPGFHSIITPHPPQLNFRSEEAEAGDQCDSGEEGPPPGFHPLNLPPPLPSSDTETGGKQNDIEDEEDGPPPGWEFNAPSQTSTSKPSSNTADVKTRGKQDSIEDDSDGAPPGWEFSTSSQALPSKPQSNTAGPFQTSTSKQPSNAADIEMRGKQDSIEDDLDGPPPGWEFSTSSQALPSKPQSNTADMKMRGKHDEFEDDGDGPPPGWEFRALSQALPSKLPSESLLDTADMKMAGNELHEDEDDGPPPGWETTIPHQMGPPYKSPLWASLASSSGREMGSKGEIKTDEEVHPSQSQPESKLEQLPPPTPPPQLLVSSADIQMGNREADIKNEGKRLASVPSPQSVQPKNLQSPQQPAPPPVASSSPSGQSTEKAQLVCGTCRKLLLYPRGAKWVQCPGCQEVNLVLEAHQIGQVNCGGCAVLLMYQHGAPAVKCSTCQFVTQIGAHNRRPPLSVQQSQRRRRAIRGR